MGAVAWKLMSIHLVQEDNTFCYSNILTFPLSLKYSCVWYKQTVKNYHKWHPGLSRVWTSGVLLLFSLKNQRLLYTTWQIQRQHLKTEKWWMLLIFTEQAFYSLIDPFTYIHKCFASLCLILHFSGLSFFFKNWFFLRFPKKKSFKIYDTQ